MLLCQVGFLLLNMNEKCVQTKVRFFFSYFLTVVQQIIVYVNLGTRCLKPSALLLDILVFTSGISLGEILGEKREMFLSVYISQVC